MGPDIMKTKIIAGLCEGKIKWKTILHCLVGLSLLPHFLKVVTTQAISESKKKVIKEAVQCQASVLDTQTVTDTSFLFISVSHVKHYKLMLNWALRMYQALLQVVMRISSFSPPNNLYRYFYYNQVTDENIEIWAK